jgi:ceramide glucosyltransferase
MTHDLMIILPALMIAERWWKLKAVKRFFAIEPPPPFEPTPTTISVIQPILSGDPTLWDCLERNLRARSNHNVEFIWLVDDDDLAAHRGCQIVASRNPEAQVSIFSCAKGAANASPKTVKLMQGLQLSTREIFCALDDDTVLKDYALDEAVAHLADPFVGCAFGLPYYTSFGNYWSSLISCFVNGNSILTYVPYTFLIQPFTINGMFYVTKRSTLLSVGGLSGIETAICDDYALAQRFIGQGYRIVQTAVRHPISIEVADRDHFLSIIRRWFIFTRASVMTTSMRELLIFYFVVFVPNFFPLILLLWNLITPDDILLVGTIAYFSYYYYMIYTINKRYLQNTTPTELLSTMLLFQLFLPVLILWSLMSPGRIRWRGHIMDVAADGTFNFVQRRPQSL